MDEKPGDVLTIEELSIYLKIPKSPLYKLVREGKIPSQKVVDLIDRYGVGVEQEVLLSTFF